MFVEAEHSQDLVKATLETMSNILGESIAIKQGGSAKQNPVCEIYLQVQNKGVSKPLHHSLNSPRQVFILVEKWRAFLFTLEVSLGFPSDFNQ